jgi:hypothetical protein
MPAARPHNSLLSRCALFWMPSTTLDLDDEAQTLAAKLQYRLGQRAIRSALRRNATI